VLQGCASRVIAENNTADPQEVPSMPARKPVKSLCVRIVRAFACVAVCLNCAASIAAAGRVIISGHDPDFHATAGNTQGGINIINRTLDYVRNGNTAPILFIKSGDDNLSFDTDHRDSELGLQAAGYTMANLPGANYVRINATDFASVVLSPIAYSAIFVPSDHGGTLTNADLAALNARRTDIFDYLLAGGGLVAFAQDGQRAGGTSAVNFGFVPGTVTSVADDDPQETNLTLTQFGTSLGLMSTDINNNFYHNHFTGWTIAHQVVDMDGTRNITLAAVVPEPQTYVLLIAGLGFVASMVRYRQRARS
jgi:hypothetical protein